MSLFRSLACTIALCAAANTFAQDDLVKEIIARGVALHDKGDFKGAIDEYKQALKQDPKNVSAHYEMAHTYFSMERYDDAIEHADAVIASKDPVARQAYDLKGSALDVMGKKKEAIKSYEKGIDEYPDYYLLRFNLGLTYFTAGEMKKSERSLIEALRLKPTHPGSHYILGVCMRQQGARARAMLCFYNFLLLEQKGKRADMAYEMLSELMTQGVEKKDDQNINVTLSLNDKESDSFQAAEMAVSMQQALHLSGGDSARTEMEHFIEQTRTFFAILGELKDNDKKNKGFWWDFHVNTFYALSKSEHLTAFCYVISRPGGSKAVENWVEEHKDEIRAQYTWWGEQDRSF